MVEQGQLFIAVDPAYGETGTVGMVGVRNNKIAFTRAHQFMYSTMSFKSIKGQWTSGPPGWYSGMICATALAWGGYETPVVVMEVPHMSGKTAVSSAGIIKVIGAVESRIRGWGWGWVEVTAPAAKKALSGYGKAEKADMVDAAIKWCGQSLPFSNTVAENSALADACGIALAGIKKWENKQDE